MTLGRNGRADMIEFRWGGVQRNTDEESAGVPMVTVIRIELRRREIYLSQNRLVFHHSI
jgi:hypothetical protein